MKRILVAAAALLLAADVRAQGTVLESTDDFTNSYYFGSGPAVTRLEVRNQCSLPATVSVTFTGGGSNDDFSQGTDTKVVPAKGMSAFDHNQRYEGAEFTTGGNLARIKVQAAGGPTIVEDPKGVCKKVTVNCKAGRERVGWTVIIKPQAAVPNPILRQGVVLDETVTTEPVACGTPKTGTTPTEPASATGLGDLYQPKPIDDPNRPPVVDEDEVFGGTDKPSAPKPPDDGSFKPNPIPAKPDLDTTIRAAGAGAIDFTRLRCGLDSDCVPFDDCTDGACGGESYAPKGGGFDDLYQLIMGEMPRVQISVTVADARRRAMNPLGLLAKSVSEFVDWWMPALQAAETESLIEQAGLKRGLQFIINSQGGSTGKNLTMQVLNFTGKPMNLQGALALEPLKKDAQQKTMQAFSKLAGRTMPAKVDLNGYCLEFLKLPPIAGQVLSVAPQAVQKKFEPMKRVMMAANQLAQSGGFKPDSNPAGYADSIKQWAIWTTQEKFNQSKFGEAFVSHTKKIVEAAGQKWSRPTEDMLRQRVPNRWQDIARVLKGAGIAVN